MQFLKSVSTAEVSRQFKETGAALVAWWASLTDEQKKSLGAGGGA